MGKFTSGFLFGMILQIAVGPTCLYLLNISIVDNFAAAFVGVIAVVIVDALYIFLAIIGISKFLNKKRIRFFKFFAGFILIALGVYMMFSFMNANSLPDLQTVSIYNKNNVFVYSAFLTLSNPLTIIFWSGIFSSKMIEQKYGRLDLIIFSCGCLFATLLFLSGITATGSLIQKFFTENLIKILNIIIGIIIIILGIKLLFSRIKPKRNNNA